MSQCFKGEEEKGLFFIFKVQISKCKLIVSFQVYSSLPFRLKLRAKVAPLLLYPGVLLGLLSHLCYMRTTFFPFC